MIEPLLIWLRGECQRLALQPPCPSKVALQAAIDSMVYEVQRDGGCKGALHMTDEYRAACAADMESGRLVDVECIYAFNGIEVGQAFRTSQTEANYGMKRGFYKPYVPKTFTEIDDENQRRLQKAYAIHGSR